MAGYRPKSLGELDDIYDKTISAKKAIIKASEGISIEPQQESTEPLPVKEESSPVKEISFEMDSLLDSFKEIPSPKVHTFEEESPNLSEKSIHEKAEELKAELKFEEVSAVKEEKLSEKIEKPQLISKKQKSAEAQPNEEALSKKQTSKSEERNELFDDYMKIMNDEDEESEVHRKDFFHYKRKKKKNKNAEKTDEFVLDEEMTGSEAFFDDLRDMDEDIDSEGDEAFQVEVSSQPAEEKSEDEELFEAFDFEKQDEDSKAEEVQEVHITTYEEFLGEEPSKEIEDIYSYNPGKLSSVPKSEQNSFTFSPEAFENEGEVMKYIEADESEEYGEYEEGKEKAARKKTEKKGLKLLYSIIMILFLLLGSLSCVLRFAVGVDTGREFSGKYVFTAKEDDAFASVKKGDLILCENRYALDGEYFAYVNHAQQRFVVAKRNGSIVNIEGDVIIIGETATQRVLVNRDDTRGTFEKSIPILGTAFGFLSGNYLIVSIISLIGYFAFFLLLIFSGKKGKELEAEKGKTAKKEKKSKAEKSKKSEKANDADGEDAPLTESEEVLEDEAEADLFSTID